MAQPHIVVVGSTNTDITVVAEHLPAPGETVLGSDLVKAGGGKGANQAVAAARAGGRVSFVARVGRDEFGDATLQRLADEGIDTDCIRVDEHAPSGVALIVVDEQGENLIAVAPGANARLSPEDVAAARDAIRSSDLVLLQLEVPIETVSAAVNAAGAASVPVLLNPAPARDLPADLLENVDYLTPNAGEAARLLHIAEPAGAEQMARRLVERGVGVVILTLGAEGACCCEGAECWRVAAPRVRAVDSVGAGDCFCGALGVAVGEGHPLRQAVRFATCAAAISVGRKGAQPSLPHREEIETMFKQPGSE
jgi:ribokinase